MKYKLELEQAQMLISDFESHLMNSVAEEDDIQRFIDTQSNILDVVNVEEAQQRVNEYVKMMKQMKTLLDNEKLNMKREINKRKEVEYVRD